MTDIRVDGRPFATGQRAGTFGELLAVLDPAMATHSRIVTAIRVDGVEEPAFREEAARHRTLDADRVEVETRTVVELAIDALSDSVRLMPAVAEAARQLGRQLSQADAPLDAAALAELAEGLTLLVTLVQAAEAWADAGARERGDWLGTHVVQVGQCIDDINEAQRDQDWVSVADALTYDLVPALESWRGSLSQALADFGGPTHTTAAGVDHAPHC